MDPKEVYIRSLLLQYQVFRQELRAFTMLFFAAILTVPVAWVINHVEHNYQLGWMIAFVAGVLGLATATHCGNTLGSIKRVANDLNAEMAEYRTFQYDLGQETNQVRYYVTLIGKGIGIGILVWCFFKNPQL